MTRGGLRVAFEKDFSPKIVSFDSTSEAEKAFRKAGCSDAGARLMAPKAVFRVIKLTGVRNAVANILKQEALAVGADAAVNKGCVNCMVKESNVFLMGSVKQLRFIAGKMKAQVSECPALGEALEQVLNSSLY
jgi:dihydropteroate synthase